MPISLGFAGSEKSNALRDCWSEATHTCLSRTATRAADPPVAVLSFILYWSDFISPLLYLRDQDLYTLPLGLRREPRLPTGAVDPVRLVVADDLDRARGPIPPVDAADALVDVPRE